MDTSPAIQTFLDTLLKEKHGEMLTPQELASMKEELLPRLTKWLMLKAMGELAQHSPETLMTLKRMIGENKPAEDVQQFLEMHIPDYEAFLTKSLNEFRQTYVAG